MKKSAYAVEGTKKVMKNVPTGPMNSLAEERGLRTVEPGVIVGLCFSRLESVYDGVIEKYVFAGPEVDVC